MRKLILILIIGLLLIGCAKKAPDDKIVPKELVEVKEGLDVPIDTRDTIKKHIEKKEVREESCVSECEILNDIQCFGEGYRTCGNFDSDSCLEWQFTQCQGSSICEEGSCVFQETRECVRAPIDSSDLCTDYRCMVNGITDGRCYISEGNCNSVCFGGFECETGSDCNDGDPQTEDECINPSTEEAHCLNQPVTQYLEPGNYAEVNGCQPFEGSSTAPLKILFVSVNNAPHFEALRDEIVENQIQAIPPFSDNIEKISLYELHVTIDEDELACSGAGAGLGGSGFICDNEALYSTIQEQCSIDDTSGVVTIAFIESEYGGTGGDLIYVGTRGDLDEEAAVGLVSKAPFHEIAHNMGLADLYYGTFYFDGSPSRFWPSDMAQAFLNVDRAGCSKWCSSYKPVGEYTESIASTCLQLATKNECVAYGRDSSRSCLYSNGEYECCVWSDTPFEYFETNCAPTFGSEDIGVSCLSNTGCYFGAVYGNDAWRPVRDKEDSIMFSTPAEAFDHVSLKAIEDVFTCCLSEADNAPECTEFRKEYSDFLNQYNFKKRIGSCGKI